MASAWPGATRSEGDALASDGEGGWRNNLLVGARDAIVVASVLAAGLCVGGVATAAITALM